MFGRLFATLVFSAASVRAAAPAAPEGTYEVRFDRELQLSDLRLTGHHASHTVTFNCEASVRALPGTALHVFVAHAPGLDGDRSFLSITLNYGILRSVRLDEENESLTEVAIPVPPNLLKPRNELVFSAEQWRSGAASDAAWTVIEARSYLSVEYERSSAAADLRLLPFPLLDLSSYRPQAFDVLRPQNASTKTLEATALLVANFANRLAPRPASVEVVESLSSRRHPLLIVGTPEEQPELRLVVATGALAPTQGLAAVVTGHDADFLPVVFVTGGSPDAVRNAARRLVLSSEPPSGTSLQVPDDTAYSSPAPRAWKGFMPPRTRFSLEDMGLNDLRADGQHGFSLELPLDATPDARFLPYGSQMVLRLLFDPSIAAQPCRLVIEFNGTRLRELAGSETAKGLLPVTLGIPAGLLHRRNSLKLYLEGPLDTLGPQAYFSLLPDSHFYFPRDYRAELPNLGLLRFHFYPFSLVPDFSGTVVLLPDQVSRQTFGALVELADVLGRVAPASHVSFAVRRLGELPAEERAGLNIIYLYDPRFGKPPQSIFPNWPPPERMPFRSAPAVEEAASPWNWRKFVLTISASQRETLDAPVERLFSEGMLARLTGDAAYLTAGEPDCFIAAPHRTLEDTDYFTHLDAWLRANWLALPVILALVSGLLFVALRLTLDRYKRRRLPRWTATTPP